MQRLHNVLFFAIGITDNSKVSRIYDVLIMVFGNCTQDHAVSFVVARQRAENTVLITTSVYPSVCPSCCGIVSKRIHISRKFWTIW